MKNSSRAQSATSLPRAPRDDADSRTFRYFLMMAIRVACFVLMIVIVPYGWHTLLLGVGAIFLPYVAVVIANVARGGGGSAPETPEKALPEHPTEQHLESPPVVQISEAQALEQPSTAARDDDPGAAS